MTIQFLISILMNPNYFLLYVPMRYCFVFAPEYSYQMFLRMRDCIYITQSHCEQFPDTSSLIITSGDG